MSLYDFLHKIQQHVSLGALYIFFLYGLYQDKRNGNETRWYLLANETNDITTQRDSFIKQSFSLLDNHIFANRIDEYKDKNLTQNQTIHNNSLDDAHTFAGL